MNPSKPETLITLRDGFTARLTPCLLLARLESEGFSFKLGDGDDVLCRPLSQLHPDDRAALRSYKPDVIRLLRYMPSDQRQSKPEPVAVHSADERRGIA